MGPKAMSIKDLMMASIISSAVVGTLVSIVLNHLLQEQNTRIQETVRAEVQLAAEEARTRIQETVRAEVQLATEEARTRREWTEQSLSELMGPVYTQLVRTKLAFERWKGKNLFLESKIIRTGNQEILNLLLTRSSLIPQELRDCASRLIQHYDVWLEEFERKRLAEKPDLETPFVFAGPKGFPFPTECDQKFRNKFQEMWAESYGPAPPR